MASLDLENEEMFAKLGPVVLEVPIRVDVSKGFLEEVLGAEGPQVLNSDLLITCIFLYFKIHGIISIRFSK